MIARRTRWLDALLEAQGAPYVWGGHGWDIWTLKNGEPHYGSHDFGVEVFDCAGLFTTTLWKAGGPDLRRSHNAQTLFDACLPAQLHNRPLNALFYGTHEKAIEHVALIVGCSACEGPISTLKIEAAGGGRGTVVPRVPLGLAKVMIRRENRRDFIQEKMLPPDWLEPVI